VLEAGRSGRRPSSRRSVSAASSVADGRSWPAGPARVQLVGFYRLIAGLRVNMPVFEGLKGNSADDLHAPTPGSNLIVKIGTPNKPACWISTVAVVQSQPRNPEVYMHLKQKKTRSSLLSNPPLNLPPSHLPLAGDTSCPSDFPPRPLCILEVVYQQFHPQHRFSRVICRRIGRASCSKLCPYVQDCVEILANCRSPESQTIRVSDSPSSLPPDAAVH
jgi:hypothetical protein